VSEVALLSLQAGTEPDQDSGECDNGVRGEVSVTIYFLVVRGRVRGQVSVTMHFVLVRGSVRGKVSVTTCCTLVRGRARGEVSELQD
jgi:hypothetical protein